MVSVMLAEMLAGVYKKLWTNLLLSNTTTKAQKVELMNLILYVIKTQWRTEWKTDLQLQGRAREKRTRKTGGNYILWLFKRFLKL